MDVDVQKKNDVEGGKDRRNFIRTAMSMDVKLSHAELGEYLLKIGDISDGGAYVYTEDRPLPGVGEIVDIQVQGLPDGMAPVVKMRIRRIDKNGAGMSYLDLED